MSVEQPAWTTEPNDFIVTDFLRSYLFRRSQETRSDKKPVPAFGQIINKPTVRQVVVPEIIDALLELDKKLSQPVPGQMPSAEFEPLPLDSARTGKQIYEALAEHRNGPEQLLDADVRDTIEALASDHSSDPLIKLAGLALENASLNHQPITGSIQEARLALQLFAISRPTDSAAA